MTHKPAEDAVAAVRSHAKLESAVELIATSLPDFPEFWYVTSQDDGRPTVGGVAFVVDRDLQQVTEVPGSRPPRVNCEEVRQARNDDDRHDELTAGGCPDWSWVEPGSSLRRIWAYSPLMMSYLWS